MRGPGVMGMPPMVTRSDCVVVTGRVTPACWSLRWFWMYLSDSAEERVEGAVEPFLTSAVPDSREFFAGLNVNHLSNVVKPILASLPISF